MTITKSGDLVSFYSVNKAPIEHLKVYFDPKQDGEGAANLENIKPLIKWDSVEVECCQNNLFIGDNKDNPRSMYHCTSTGTIEYNQEGNYFIHTGYGVGYSQHSGKYHKLFVAKAPMTVTFSIDYQNLGTDYGIRLYKNSTRLTDIHGTYNSGVEPEWRHFSRTIVLDKNDYIATIHYGAIKWRNMCIELGSAFDEYKPYIGSMLTSSFSTDKEIYGGYVDLVTGEVWKTYEIANASIVAEWLRKPTTVLFQSGKAIRSYMPTNVHGGNITIQCTHFEDVGPVGNWAMDAQSKDGYVVEAGGGSIMFIASELGFTTTEEWAQWVIDNNVQYVYPLATPILVETLSPTELKTYTGQNNIMSTGDNVEVKYDLAESNDELYRRRNIILKSAPHIETATGDIASFNTDLVAPVKSAKISFNPVQEGEGDPSPNNVRAISGWNGIELHKDGKNLFDKSRYLSSKNHMYVSSLTGNTTIWSNSYAVTDFVPIKGGINYILHDAFYAQNSVGAAIYDKNKQYLTGFEINSRTNYVWPFTTPSNAAYIRFCVIHDYAYGITFDWEKCMIEVGESATEFESYIGSTILIDWANDIGTIYGGYVDLVTGEVWKTWDIVELADLDWVGSGNRARANNTISLPAPAYREKPNFIAEKYYAVPYSVSLNAEPAGIALNSSGFIAYYDGSTLPTGKMTYPLVNPFLVTTLTPTQLTTLRGANNIWANTNGPIEIKYWTH